MDLALSFEVNRQGQRNRAIHGIQSIVDECQHHKKCYDHTCINTSAGTSIKRHDDVHDNNAFFVEIMSNLKR